jgi:hypothetical protein
LMVAQAASLTAEARETVIDAVVRIVRGAR